MRYRLTINTNAEQDYTRIAESFMHAANFPDYAIRKALALRETIREIVHYPHRFPRAGGDFWDGRDVHYRVIDTFVAFFEINDTGQTITVLRILDYRTDCADFFGSDTDEPN